MSQIIVVRLSKNLSNKDRIVVSEFGDSIIEYEDSVCFHFHNYKRLPDSLRRYIVEIRNISLTGTYNASTTLKYYVDQIFHKPTVIVIRGNKMIDNNWSESAGSLIHLN